MTATLDIDTVQAFLLVAELQGFTRAAEALGTTQAAISRNCSGWKPCSASGWSSARRARCG